MRRPTRAETAVYGEVRRLKEALAAAAETPPLDAEFTPRQYRALRKQLHDALLGFQASGFRGEPGHGSFAAMQVYIDSARRILGEPLLPLGWEEDA